MSAARRLYADARTSVGLMILMVCGKLTPSSCPHVPVSTPLDAERKCIEMSGFAEGTGPPIFLIGSQPFRRAAARLSFSFPHPGVLLMYLVRPVFRPWRILAAIVFVYPLAGALYGIWHELYVWLLQPLPSHDIDGIMFGLFLTPIYIVRMSIMTLTTLGFPYRFVDSEETVNLYPIILPTALMLLAWATRALRFGRKVRTLEPTA